MEASKEERSLQQAAIAWYKRAAKGGETSAQTRLGFLPLGAATPLTRRLEVSHGRRCQEGSTERQLALDSCSFMTCCSSETP